MGKDRNTTHCRDNSSAVTTDLHTQIMQPPCLSFTDILLEKKKTINIQNITFDSYYTSVHVCTNWYTSRNDNQKVTKLVKTMV